jgi:hypothetical protein
VRGSFRVPHNIRQPCRQYPIDTKAGTQSGTANRNLGCRFLSCSSPRRDYCLPLPMTPWVQLRQALFRLSQRKSRELLVAGLVMPTNSTLLLVESPCSSDGVPAQRSQSRQSSFIFFYCFGISIRTWPPRKTIRQRLSFMEKMVPPYSIKFDSYTSLMRSPSSCA